MLESREDEKLYEVPGGFGNMFDDIVLPGTSTNAALEFEQK
jgi:hypothetical protein